MRTKFAAMIHNQFMKKADWPIRLNHSFYNGYCIFRVDDSKFIDCQDLSWRVSSRTSQILYPLIASFIPVDISG